MKHDVALKVAEALVEYLRPVCERIEIMGSIRREKPDVKDIELLVISDLVNVPRRAPLEFGKPIPPSYKTALDKLIVEMKEADAIRLEPGYPHHDKNGERLKSFYLKYAGIQVDLSIVLPPATWGVQAVIRTGPADFSHWCVTRRKNGGALSNGYRVQDGAVWLGELPIKNPEIETRVGFAKELEFLEFLGLGWIEPREREAKWR